MLTACECIPCLAVLGYVYLSALSRTSAAYKAVAVCIEVKTVGVRGIIGYGVVIVICDITAEVTE